MNWNHYSNASDGCVIKGGTIGSLDITAPFTQTPGQVIIQGAPISDNGGLNYSAQLAAGASFTLFNAVTFPSGVTGNLVPGSFYKWQVRCGCIIDLSIPLPQRLNAGNIHLSPWSEFDLFTNLSVGPIANEAHELKLNIGTDLNELTLFPNPTDDHVIIRASEGSISIYDMLGKEMYVGTISNDQIEIDVSSWAPGIYLVRVVNGHLNSYAQKRLIVH